MLCKRTFKNQITLPKKIMVAFDDVEYFEAEAKADRIILVPVKISPLKKATLSNVRKKISSLGLSDADINKAIDWARKK